MWKTGVWRKQACSCESGIIDGTHTHTHTLHTCFYSRATTGQTASIVPMMCQPIKLRVFLRLNLKKPHQNKSFEVRFDATRGRRGQRGRARPCAETIVYLQTVATKCVPFFFLNEAIAFQSSRIVLTFPLLTENYLEIIAAGQHRIGGRKKINSTCLSHKTKITCLYLRRSATALFTVNTYSAIRRRENSPLMVIIAYIYRPPAPTGK